MKKQMAVWLALVLVLTVLSGCSGTNSVSEESVSEAVSENQTPTETAINVEADTSETETAEETSVAETEAYTLTACAR